MGMNFDDGTIYRNVPSNSNGNNQQQSVDQLNRKLLDLERQLESLIGDLKRKQAAERRAEEQQYQMLLNYKQQLEQQIMASQLQQAIMQAAAQSAMQQVQQQQMMQMYPWMFGL